MCDSDYILVCRQRSRNILAGTACLVIECLETVSSSRASPCFRDPILRRPFMRRLAHLTQQFVQCSSVQAADTVLPLRSAHVQIWKRIRKDLSRSDGWTDAVSRRTWRTSDRRNRCRRRIQFRQQRFDSLECRQQIGAWNAIKTTGVHQEHDVCEKHS